MENDVNPDTGIVWSYGITCVPERLTTTLPKTLLSLTRSGFKFPVVFMDGELPFGFSNEYIYLISRNKVPVITHPNIGHLANWMSSLFYLYASNPKADRYALFEDDILVCSNLRMYLELCPYPEKGYLNLATHAQNLVLTDNVPGWHKSNQRGRGAMGLAFNNETVRTLLKSEIFVDRLIGRKNKAADGMVLEALQDSGYKEFIHCPTLIQHMEGVSTLGHGFGKLPGFKGEDYDPLPILNLHS